jgi:2-dehydro-3-deoxygalactonokinase
LEPQLHSACLIALDWGTTTLRAYLLGEQGLALQVRTSPHGIMRLPELQEPSAGNRQKRFEAAFESICGDWLRQFPSLPVIAAGMIGSAQGWKETRYLHLPFNLEELGRHLVSFATATGRPIWIVPGLMDVTPPMNVMRGEETQVLGALFSEAPETQEEGRLFCLPGTHSKWINISRHEIRNFTTFMTGEVYSALCSHTILGQTMPENAKSSFDATAFERGVDLACCAGSKGILSDIFTTRTLALAGVLAPEQQADYLSGILIGHEVQAMFHPRPDSSVEVSRRASVTLVGDETLCHRYAAAMKRLGEIDVRFSRDAMQRGFWNVAIQAGLIARQ